jgi:hypothetical protein
MPRRCCSVALGAASAGPRCPDGAAKCKPTRPSSCACGLSAARNRRGNCATSRRVSGGSAIGSARGPRLTGDELQGGDRGGGGEAPGTNRAAAARGQDYPLSPLPVCPRRRDPARANSAAKSGLSRSPTGAPRALEFARGPFEGRRIMWWRVAGADTALPSQKSLIHIGL